MPKPALELWSFFGPPQRRFLFTTRTMWPASRLSNIRSLCSLLTKRLGIKFWPRRDDSAAAWPIGSRILALHRILLLYCLNCRIRYFFLTKRKRNYIIRVSQPREQKKWLSKSTTYLQRGLYWSLQRN